ncbi:MAG: cytochrome c4 [Gammaproteobacteria bacterium]|nr:cytochrome c4 [Gammaproteobacteria bacterium]
MAVAIAPASHAADADAGKAKSATCAACHGADGKAIIPAYPNLAGQHAGYTAKQLMNFRDGDRVNPVMSPMAAGLSDEDIADLAAYYESLPAIPGVADESAELQKGADIFQGGIAGTGIPACSGCHAPNGSGNPAANFPALSGQDAGYLEAQLKAFRAGERQNDPGSMMRSLAKRMTDDEIAALANYIAGLH